MENKTNLEKILIVDDDESITASLSILLKRAGYISIVAMEPDQALSILKEEQLDLIIHDMNFSQQTNGEEGMSLLNDIRKFDTNIPVILMTAWGSIDLAVQGIKSGASNFVSKPWSNDNLLQIVDTALQLNKSSPDTSITREQLDQQYDFKQIIGSAPTLLQVLEIVGRVSATDASVLILGESGTGKELIADAIHRNSKRNGFPLVKVNLGGVPGTLFESEMFGHVKGAFTDAKTERVGRFEAANNGSIFLDEIGDLDKSSQVKLLRVLQDQSYQPLGSSQTKKANVRIISATNCDLESCVETNSFREDLLYRINLITLHLPPLRERKEDIPQLAYYFMKQVCQRYQHDNLALSEDAVKWLQEQVWPGNIRELSQTIERAVLIANAPILTRQSFQDACRMDKQNTNATASLPVGSMTLDEMEKAMIVKAMEQYNNNLSSVANALGLSRQALYRRIEKHGIAF